MLCGGLATRLRPVSLHTPKILLPYRGRTILEWTLEYLEGYEVILAAGFLGEKVLDSAPSWVEVVIEKEPLGTGGALKNLEDILDPTFLVMNGDIVTSIPTKVLEFHHYLNKTLATIALTIQSSSKELDSVKIVGNKIVEYGKNVSNLCNAGIYVIEHSVLDLIPRSRCSLENRIFPELCRKKRLAGVTFNCPWWHIRDLEDYFKDQDCKAHDQSYKAHIKWN